MNIPTNPILTTNTNLNTQMNMITASGSGAIDTKATSKSKKKVDNTLMKNIYPLQVENGNKMFTKMKLNPNIQVLLKDLRQHPKNSDFDSIFRKKFKLL